MVVGFLTGGTAVLANEGKGKTGSDASTAGCKGKGGCKGGCKGKDHKKKKDKKAAEEGKTEAPAEGEATE